MRDLFYEADKLHEECGVFGIYSHKDDVALNTYWGLFALQHRCQESAGIIVSDGQNVHVKRIWALFPMCSNQDSRVLTDILALVMSVIPRRAAV